MVQYRGGPYRFRTFLRTNLPWFIIETGVVDKGLDCEKVNGSHEWYNIDGRSSGCYHCQVARQGKLWLKK